MQLAFVVIAIEITLVFGKRIASKFELQNNPVTSIFLYHTRTSALEPPTGQYNTCHWLSKSRRLYQTCSKNRALQYALDQSHSSVVKQCEEQFLYDRWNCSRTKHVFEKIYRETAFMHALAVAGTAAAVARTCAEGKIHRCECDRESKRLQKAWKWSTICSDNIKYGRSFTKRFFNLIHTGTEDYHAAIMQHNGLVGLRTVRAHLKTVCKCHGVSGSCSLRTCWKKLTSIAVMTADLKQKFYHAIKVNLNNAMKRQTHRGAGKSWKSWPKDSLLYLEQSPTYCSTTKGRKCQHSDNCATLCCGRGYITKVFGDVRSCNCSLDAHFHMNCRRCRFNVKQFFCK